MDQAKEIFKRGCIIVCEGAQDKSFLEKLVANRNLPLFDIVHPREQDRIFGRAGFAQRLRSIKFASGFDQTSGILVVSDNDGRVKASFEEVRKQLHEAGFGTPNRPGETIISGGRGIAVLMWPLGEESGSLETMCLRAMRAHAPQVAQCMDSFVACAGVDKWSQGKREKAMVRFMISSQCKPDPNTSLVWAWSDNRPTMIPLDNSAFDGVADFLKDFHSLAAKVRDSESRL